MDSLKEGGRQLVAGGTAGMVEVCLMHPLDLIKTRLQIGGGHYSGLADCFRQTLNKEGPLGFYKGILPPILAETPKRATKFFTFEQYKRALEPLGQWDMPAWAVRLFAFFVQIIMIYIIKLNKEAFPGWFDEWHN